MRETRLTALSLPLFVTKKELALLGTIQHIGNYLRTIWELFGNYLGTMRLRNPRFSLTFIALCLENFPESLAPNAGGSSRASGSVVEGEQSKKGVDELVRFRLGKDAAAADAEGHACCW